MKYPARTPVPKCCEAMQQNPVVYLAVPMPPNETGEPQWWALSAHEENEREWPAPGVKLIVHFCPYCGVRLPGVKKKARPGRVTSCTDGGYYCATCDERLIVCRCKPPAAAYEVA